MILLRFIGLSAAELFTRSASTNTSVWLQCLQWTEHHSYRSHLMWPLWCHPLLLEVLVSWNQTQWDFFWGGGGKSDCTLVLLAASQPQGEPAGVPCLEWSFWLQAGLQSALTEVLQGRNVHAIVPVLSQTALEGPSILHVQSVVETICIWCDAGIQVHLVMQKILKP